MEKIESKINMILEFLEIDETEEALMKKCSKWIKKNINNLKLVMSQHDYDETMSIYNEAEDQDMIEKYKNVNIASYDDIIKIKEKIQNNSKCKTFNVPYCDYYISDDGIVCEGAMTSIYVIK